MRFMNRGIYYSPDDSGAGSGSGEGEGQGGQGAPSLPDDARRSLERLVERQGGYDATAFLLFDENRGYRNQIRQLEQQVRDLEGRAPAEDAVVLSGEDATRWQAYQELGEPDALLAQRQQYETLQRRQMLTEAAAAAGYKPAVLERLADGLTVEVREEQQDGKAVRVPYVVDGDDATALTAYAEEQWADFLPALAAEEGANAHNSQGRTFVQQTPAGASGSKDIAQRVLEEQREREKERKNPLMTG